jgi:hypothetical protein
MKLFYDRVMVGTGIVITCIGMGTAFGAVAIAFTFRPPSRVQLTMPAASMA